MFSPDLARVKILGQNLMWLTIMLNQVPKPTRIFPVYQRHFGWEIKLSLNMACFVFLLLSPVRTCLAINARRRVVLKAIFLVYPALIFSCFAEILFYLSHLLMHVSYCLSDFFHSTYTWTNLSILQDTNYYLIS